MRTIKSTRMSMFLIGMLVCLVLIGFLSAKGITTSYAASQYHQLHYYGANLQYVEQATGVHLDGTVNPNGPWPQFTQNYCFIAVAQAVINFDHIRRGLPLRFPHQDNQGPASGDPKDEQVGQILWDMDHLMIPPGGPLQAKGTGPNRRPFTLGNIAYDFGGDPRVQAFATNFEDPFHKMNYHEHIYHTDTQTATLGMAKALARSQSPVLVLANHALHTLLVAGFWATANPLTNPDAQIDSFAVFNPWNGTAWGQYITTGPYQRVSLNDWLTADHLPTPFGGATTFLKRAYESNGILDPDPSIGVYQTGPGTHYPNKHHWIGNFVIIQPDWHMESADFAFDENDRLMLQP